MGASSVIRRAHSLDLRDTGCHESGFLLISVCVHAGLFHPPPFLAGSSSPLSLPSSFLLDYFILYSFLFPPYLIIHPFNPSSFFYSISPSFVVDFFSLPSPLFVLFYSLPSLFSLDASFLPSSFLLFFYSLSSLPT